MATREATPPPVIGKAGRYTVFITPPATPRPSEGSRSQSSSPSPSPKISPRNVAPLQSETFRSLSSSAREKMRSNLSPKVGVSLPVKSPSVEPPSPMVAPPPPPVQVPPPQFEKGKGGKSAGSFGFFWDAVAKVQNAHSSLDQYLADWLGLDQSRYQWALNDYYENNGSAKDGGKSKELASKGQTV
ncbi:extensin [Asparagus officinalis]|uniref:extensin n=1 Tax=Asparagus officinalis TaxID=4686 RepID=UPI00098DF8BD|nr:extensin [Asparagus officinalis]